MIPDTYKILNKYGADEEASYKKLKERAKN